MGKLRCQKCGDLGEVFVINNLKVPCTACYMSSPRGAYIYAMQYGPEDRTRKKACELPVGAFKYARFVDGVPRDDTRAAACKEPLYAAHYAQHVDKTPRDDTRAAACAGSSTESCMAAYIYAKDVDKSSHPDTLVAACIPDMMHDGGGSSYLIQYAKEIDKGPCDATRAEACKRPKDAHYYALWIDEGPRDDTRTAACKDPEWAYAYAMSVDKGSHPETRAACNKSPHMWGSTYKATWP